MYCLTYGQLYTTLTNLPAVFKEQRYFVFRQLDRNPKVCEKTELKHGGFSLKHRETEVIVTKEEFLISP